jgi:hypothetical protein
VLCAPAGMPSVGSTYPAPGGLATIGFFWQNSLNSLAPTAGTKYWKQSGEIRPGNKSHAGSHYRVVLR